MLIGLFLQPWRKIQIKDKMIVVNLSKTFWLCYILNQDFEDFNKKAKMSEVDDWKQSGVCVCLPVLNQTKKKKRRRN